MSQPKHVYRVDKFKVPASAESEFVARALETQQILRRQPGIIETRLLKKSGGPGVFNFVSIAVWSSPEAMLAAKDVMLAHQASTGFDPDEFRARVGIEADVASYEDIIL